MTKDHDGSVRLDPAAVIAWFTRIYGSTNGDLINIVRTDDWTGRFVSGHDLEAIEQTITDYDRAEPAGIYHRITTVTGVPDKYKRGDAALSHLLPGFWADIDVNGPGHKSKGRLPEDREAGMRIVTNSSLPEPSLWVDSGGGLYPWWLLDEPKKITPENLEAVSRLSEDVQAELERSARELGLECAPMADLARVLRIPGTVNRKVEGSPTMCRIIQDTGAVYSIREIRESVPRGSTKKSKPSAGNEDPQAVLNGLPEGPPCPVMARKLDSVSEAMREAEVGNRHKTTLSAIGGIIRMGNVGHAGAADALEDLQLVFQEIKPEADDRAWDGLVSYVLEREEIIPEPEREYCGTLCFDSAPVPAGDDEEEEEDTGRDGRIRVNVSNRDRAGRQLRELIGSGPLSGMFHREGELVYTPRIGEEGYVPPPEGEDGPAQIHTIEALDLKSMIEVEMAVGGSKRRTRITQDESGEEQRETIMEWEPKMLPMEVANQLRSVSRMKLGVPNLRVLKSVTHTPIIRADGSIFAVPDYDPRTRMLYLPDEVLDIPEIGDVDYAAVTAAAALLSSIVEEFPFVTETHRANWFGALFTPLMRSLLPPPYPAFVMDAPSPGSGKSLLEKIIRGVHGGVFRSGWPGEEAEVGKSILSTLITTTSPVITFDNVRGRINSPIFEGLLTSDTYSHRQLGSTKNVATPNDRLWIITANNAEIGGDLARRFYWVTIDPGMPRPFERTRFKLDLNTWIPANRGRILHAMLTIIRGWVLEQRPAAPSRRSDSCAVWDAGMNDLLSWAGISEEFGKAEERHQDSDDDREWLTFLSEVHRVMGGERFKIRDLADKIKDLDGDPFGSNSGGLDPSVLPGDLADKWSRVGMGSHAGFTKSLGRWTKNRAGRYVGDLVLKIFPDPKRGDSYEVHRVFETGQTGTN